MIFLPQSIHEIKLSSGSACTGWLCLEVGQTDLLSKAQCREDKTVLLLMGGTKDLLPKKRTMTICGEDSQNKKNERNDLTLGI